VCSVEEFSFMLSLSWTLPQGMGAPAVVQGTWKWTRNFRLRKHQQRQMVCQLHNWHQTGSGDWTPSKKNTIWIPRSLKILLAKNGRFVRNWFICFGDDNRCPMGGPLQPSAPTLLQLLSYPSRNNKKWKCNRIFTIETSLHFLCCCIPDNGST
jgi:hypothetical protein